MTRFDEPAFPKSKTCAVAFKLCGLTQHSTVVLSSENHAPAGTAILEFTDRLKSSATPRLAKAMLALPNWLASAISG